MENAFFRYKLINARLGLDEEADSARSRHRPVPRSAAPPSGLVGSYDRDIVETGLRMPVINSSDRWG